VTPGSGDPWAADGNAARYAAYAREFPMYRDTSRDLVTRAAPAPDAVVVDLACGTGATTAQILAALGSGGAVIGVDGSAAMLGEAAAAISDPRVRWVLARAETFDQHLSEPADVVVCNSAIWQTDFGRTARAARRALTVGGRFAFNIGAEFLRSDSADPASVDPDISSAPSLLAVMRDLAEKDYGWTPPEAAGGRRRLSADEVIAELSRAGFGEVRTEWLEYPASAEARHVWLTVPVFTGSRLPGLSYAARMDLLARARERIGPGEESSSRWLTVTATAV
jgi:ubiquinone/menaquinone biosynthesis C-methylase UbiE